MKISYFLILLLFFTLIGYGCAKDTLDPEFNGTINGRVQNSVTGEGVSFASLTTNPGTDAILTNENGEFTFEDVATGDYTVSAAKEEYKTKSVKVEVKQDKIATAQILLKSDNDPSIEHMEGTVTSFFTASRNDSMFAEVNYIIENTSDNSTINQYEVYFQIFTRGASFFQEVAGDTLDSGEQNIGEFSTYIRQFSADSVNISGIYASGS